MATTSLPTGQQRILLRYLCQGPMSIDRLVNALYASRLDGGPDDAANVVRVQVHNLRKWLKGYGVSILSYGTWVDHAYMVDPDHLDKAKELLESVVPRLALEVARRKQGIAVAA